MKVDTKKLNQKLKGFFPWDSVKIDRQFYDLVSLFIMLMEKLRQHKMSIYHSKYEFVY